MSINLWPKETAKEKEEEKEPLECCHICGKDLFDEDNAAATTLGIVLRDYEGFGSDEEPWEFVMCSECYNTKFIEVMTRIEEVLVYLRFTGGSK